MTNTETHRMTLNTMDAIAAPPGRSRQWRRWLLMAALTALAGCATVTPPPPARPLAALERAAVDPSGDSDVVELGGKSTAEEPPKSEVMEGDGKFVDPQSAKGPKQKPNTVEGEASFNFEGATIPEVAKAILGEFLQENYVIAPGVAGQVTFATTQPVAAEQAMGILEMLLAMNNYALVWREGRYLILPATEATRGTVLPRVEGGGVSLEPGFQVRAVPLRFMAATEAEKLMQPFARAGAVLKADNARSLILLAGTPADLDNYVGTLRTFDVDWMKGMSFGLFRAEKVEVKDLMPELEALFADQNSPLAGMIKLLPVERLNAVLVITPQQRYLREVERWINKLDKGGTQGGARLYVFEVQNVKAIDLADRLNEIFTGQAPQQRSNSASGRVAPGLNATEISSSSGSSVTSKNQPVPPVSLSTAPASTSSGGTGEALIEGGEDVRITAVEENNSLLIRASPAQYDIIRSAIRRLDVEPLQVHLEAKILSVSLTDELKYGVNWYLKYAIGTDAEANYVGQPAPRLNRDIDFTTRTGVIKGNVSTFIFDMDRARALVNFLQSRNNSTVLSSPSLMVLNNQQANINVGLQLPVSSVSIANPIAGGVSGAASVVQFRDTGITLDVTPRVNPGGLVYLEIQAEDSSPQGAADASGNFAVSKKTIQTQIAVQSGETVLLGGLIKQTEGRLRGGLPWVSRIPLIGGLFGNTSSNQNREELLVLITPTVIRGGSQEAQALTEEYQRRFQGLDALIREDRRRHDAAVQPNP